MWDKQTVSSVVEAISRGTALFVGLFSLLNIGADLMIPGFDANNWWIDFRPAARPAGQAVLGVLSFVLIAYAVVPKMSRGRRIISSAATVGVLIVIASNIWTFYTLISARRLYTGCLIPFSSFAAVALAIVLVGLHTKNGDTQNTRGVAGVFATVIICAAAFSLGQMLCFGKTDYRRQADAAVVFGARAYANGSCSQALSDRVVTAVRLYHDGLCKKLVFSGGPGDGSVHEVDAMQKLATDLGVSQEDILLDRNGLNTRLTVHNTARICRENGYTNILAVSHFYHLPRVKMTFEREGLEVYTVPAEHSHGLRKMPQYMLREIAALLYYYVEPIVEFAGEQIKGPAGKQDPEGDLV